MLTDDVVDISEIPAPSFERSSRLRPAAVTAVMATLLDEIPLIVLATVAVNAFTVFGLLKDETVTFVST